MRRILAAIAVVLLVGCSAPVPQPSASSRPSSVPSSIPSSGTSIPELVLVTFQLTLTGTMPADAAFAIETGQIGEEGAAVYLCAYYGGWPVCDINQGIYHEQLAFAPGTRVHYRFWRELDINGAVEEIEAGEITVGVTDQVVPVSYDIQP